jgi:signal transduction histidine kinase
MRGREGKLGRRTTTIQNEGRPGPGKETMPPYIEGVPIDNLLQEIYATATPKAAEHGVRVQVEVIAWERLVAAADAQWLRHVLLHFVDDAIASSKGGTVRIQAYPCPDDVRLTIEVREEGDGQPAAQPRWNVEGLESQMRRMAGDLITVRSPDGSRAVYCHLPQWVPEPSDRVFAA